MLDKIRKILRALFAPVASNPLFFIAIVIFSLSCVVAEAVAIGNFRKWIAVYDLMQSSVWAYLLSWLVYMWDKRWLKGVITGAWGLAALVEIAHFLLLKHPLDVQSLSLALDTNPREIGGFFRQFFTPSVIAAFAVGVVVVTVIAIGVSRSRMRVTKLMSVWSLLTMALVLGGVWRIARIAPMLWIDDIDAFTIWASQDPGNPELANIFQMNYADPVVKSTYIAKGISLERHVYNHWARLQPVAFADEVMAASSTADSLQIVVIIGESFIKSHSSLYGYHLPVNPRLEKEKADSALVVFSDMITAGNFTNMSIANLMSLNNLTDDDPTRRDWWQSVYFPLVFKKAGWRVSLFTNQYDPQSRSSDLGRLFFDPFIIGTCYDAYNDGQEPYDGDFVRSMVARHGLAALPSADALTIWHLKGQHFPARQYFPDDASHIRFTMSDIPADKSWLDDDKRQQVADYANATLYNDSIVSSIIDLYRGSDAVVVYFSDHGEEMWDTAPAGNRNKQQPDDAEWMHRQFDIPFVVWMSESFRGKYPEMADSIRRAADRPGSLDNLGQMLLHIGGIRSKYLHPDESIISDSYRPSPRISAQGYPYPETKR